MTPRFRLVTFGGLRLSADGSPVEFSRRRLALLAALAAAGEAGMSRDRVVALFWPDAPTGRGRHSLEQLLTEIRARLGPEAVAGPDPLRYAGHVIATDVTEALAALREGRDEAFALVTAAPFLDGFHLGASHEFDEWQEQQRTWFKSRRIEALERLATRASAKGDTGAAVRWWQEIVEADPLRTTGTLGLMRAMATAGDRVGAVRHARVHEEMVRAVLELPPDEAVIALRMEFERVLATLPSHSLPASPRQVDRMPGPDAALPEVRPTSRGPWVAGGALAVVILAGVLALLVPSHPGSPPDLAPVRLTYTGDATLPALSPDGKWLAYLVGRGPVGDGPVHLMVQDISSGERRRLASFRYAIRVLWSGDGRFVVVQGELNEGDNEAAYAVSLVGGVPRRLACCGGIPDPLSDTLFVNTPGPDDVRTPVIRFITMSDGVLRDTLRLKPPREDRHVSLLHRSPDGGRYLVHRWYRSGDGFQIVDRGGRSGVEDFYANSNERRPLPLGWSPDGRSILYIVFRPDILDGLNIVRHRVDRLEILQPGDTVVRDLGANVLPSMTSDGRLVYSSPGVRYRVYVMHRIEAETLAYRSRLIGEWTSRATAMPSPDGRQVLLTTRTGGSVTQNQFHLVEPESGAISPLGLPVEAPIAWGWVWEGTAAWVARHEGESDVLELIHIPSGVRRPFRRLPKGSMIRARSLPGERFVVLQGDHRHLTVLGATPAEDRVIPVAPWATVIDELSESPDGWHVAANGTTADGMEFVLGKVNLETGRWDSLPVPRPAYRNVPLLSADGSLLAPTRTWSGENLWQMMAPDESLRPVGHMPVPRARFAFSRNGALVTANQMDVAGDIYIAPGFRDRLK